MWLWSNPHPPIGKEVEEEILRMASHMKQREIAERLGISTSTVSRTLQTGQRVRRMTEEQKQEILRLAPLVHQAEIARRIGISKNTVSSFLRKQEGLAPRPRGTQGKLSEEQLEEAALHYAMGMSPSEIAKLYGVTPTTIRCRFKLAGIEKRPQDYPKLSLRKLTREEEKEAVEAVLAGMTATDVGTVLGVSRAVVSQALWRRGIHRGQKRKFSDEEARALRAAYDSGSSTGMLAQNYGVSSSTVRKAILRAGGTMRSATEHISMQKGKPQFWRHAIQAEDVPKLAQLYREGVRTKDLAEMFGVKTGTIYKTLKRYGYERRPHGGSRREHVITGLEPQLVEDHIRGMTEVQLVEKYSVTPREIRDALDRHMGSKMRQPESAVMARGPSVLSKKEKKGVVRSYVEGESIADIVGRHNVSETTVHKIVKEAGVPRRRPARALSEAQVNEIVGLYEAGETLMDIAEAFGVTQGAISYRLKRRGVKLRPRSHRSERCNPGFDAPTSLLAAASLTALAVGVWGWWRSLR